MYARDGGGKNALSAYLFISFVDRLLVSPNSGTFLVGLVSVFV